MVPTGDAAHERRRERHSGRAQAPGQEQVRERGTTGDKYARTGFTALNEYLLKEGGADVNAFYLLLSALAYAGNDAGPLDD